MKNQELIIQLLLQDLKHHQLTLGLARLGFHSECHDLAICEMVRQQMVANGFSPPGNFTDLYLSLMDLAQKWPLQANPNHLRPLAERCYRRLLETASE